MFPDAKSTRAQKHMRILAKKAELGDRAVVFFLVNRPDGKSFKVAEHIDPNYQKELTDAIHKGVEILAYRVESSPEQIFIKEPVEIEL